MDGTMDDAYVEESGKGTKRRKPRGTASRQGSTTKRDSKTKARARKATARFNELESLKIQTDAYVEELEEFKRILGDEFVAQESFQREACPSLGSLVPSPAGARAPEHARSRDIDITNAYLRHGKKSFGVGAGIGDGEDGDGVVVVDTDGTDDIGDNGDDDGSPRTEHRPNVVLSEFFGPLFPERKKIARAMELNLKLQKRMELLLASNSAALEECDAFAARINEVDLDKRQRIKDMEHGTWRYKLGQSGADHISSQSWFFRGASYAAARGFVDVAKYLKLVSNSGEWSQDERAALVGGVEEMAKERRALALMDQVEYIEDFVDLQRQHGLHDMVLAPAAAPASGDVETGATGVTGATTGPTGDSPAGSPAADPTWDAPACSHGQVEVMAEAAAMTDVEWSLLAWRHVPKRTGNECMLQWRNAANPSLKSGPFGDQEAKKLRQLVKRHGDHADAWDVIALSLPGRTPLACLQEHTREGRAEEARAREKERRIGNLCFTDEDVNRVRQLVLKHGQSWKKIAKEFGGSWTPQQIMFEWRKHLQSTGGGVLVAKKGKWSKDEDDRLVKAVAVLGRQWAKVAQHVPGRTEMQVRERYVNHLDPEVESNQPFTEEELAVVQREVPNHTNPKSGRISWAKVARLLPSRTDRQVKKAWERLSRVAPRTKNNRVKRKRNPWDDGDD